MAADVVRLDRPDPPGTLTEIKLGRWICAARFVIVATVTLVL